MVDRQGVELGKLEDFPVDEFRIVTVAGRELGVLRRGDGETRAILNVCPHRGGPVCTGRFGGSWLPDRPGTLSFGMEGRVIQCPWHGWEFDVDTGEVLFGVSRTRLLTYATWVEGDVLFVDPTPRPRSTAS